MMKKGISVVIVFAVLLVGYVGYQFFTRDTVPKVTDPQLLKIQRKGTLVVGSDMPYAKMEFFDESGKPVGFEVDIAQKIADSLGVKLVYTDYDWDRLFPTAIQSGEVDLAMSAITITPERQKEMLFSIPYFNGGQSIVTKKENDRINSVQDMADNRIGVEVDTTSYDAIKDLVPAELIRSYGSSAELVAALKSDEIDALVIDYVEVMSIVKREPTLRMVGEPFTQEYYGIASRLENTALIERANTILREMKRSGELKRLEDAWMR